MLLCNSKLPSHLQYLANNCLSSASFSQDSIAKVIQMLDPNKAHGHDHISICVLTICDSSINKLLEKIFKQCIETRVFPCEWKKGNIVPIHKKRDKQTLAKVLLLPICKKFLKDYCLTKYSNVLLEINLFHQIGLVLNLVILAFITCYLLLMKERNLLMKGLKLKACFFMYQKHLIRREMMISSSN